MENELTILSPEKTVLTYPLAGIGRRLSAHLIDVVIIVFLIYVGFVLAFLYTMRFGSPLPLVVGVVAILALPFLYFILFEGLWNGKTPGKAACGLRVRMADGTPITFGASLGRNLVRVADFIPPPYFAGVIAIFTTPRSQRLEDLVADTVVVLERRQNAPVPPAPHKAGIHPYEESIGELRGMMREEYTALKRLCDRFYELTPPVQEKLIREVFVPVALRRGIPMLPGVHPLYLAEAVVMKYGRQHGLL